ncbi:DUF1294 domain-containing protein [Novipirellula sp. SH528]|uniref:DUF1294 domain-containing protein n=1 Tax=Novipirellula sp. SH528 TaxID=3454466 RepID=UPI003F9FACAD
MRYQGKIANWNDERGFGFITPIGDGSQVFVHIKSFSGRHRRPVENDMVTYEVGTDAEGRMCAERVVFAGERLPWNTSFRLEYASLTFAGIFLGVLTGAAASGKLPFPILGLYFVASVVAFVAYGLDKLAARQGRWRTQESTLHFWGLIGGWPGASAAQSLFRHKSKKQSFQVVFWFTIAVNCSALGWLFSPSGAAVLRSIFDMSQGLTNG